MYKRIISLFIMVIIAAASAVTAFAEGLPFDDIGVPGDLYFTFSYPNEGNESIEAVFTVPDDLASLRGKTSEQQEKFYGSAYECCIQFDWSIDSEDAWHSDETWDSPDGDFPFQRLTGSFVEKTELFYFAYEEAVERCKGALTVETLKDAESEETVDVHSFDFDAHTLYVKARFFVYEYSTGKCYTGEWTDAHSVNDDFDGSNTPDAYKGSEKGAAPVISNARIDGSVVMFDLNFDDTTKREAYLLKCSGNADLNIESQIRFDGGSWDYWMLGTELTPYVVGTKVLSLRDEHLSSRIEFRCRLIGNAYNDIPGYNSGWSNILVIENGEVSLEKNNDPFDEKPAKTQKVDDGKCGVCGICPFHPFGICMFIWISLAAVVIAIIVYNVIMIKKKKKRAEEIRVRQQEARSTASAEESIINIDLTPKIRQEDNTNKSEGGEQ